MADAITADLFDKELFVGWIPIRFYLQDNSPCVDWCYLGNRRFVEPSFADTIESCLKLPFNQMFQHHTGIHALEQCARESPGIQPTGFIFHVSRCGSALVSYTLASAAQNLVLSESDPIDSVLRSNFHFPNVTDEQRIDWLRWMVSAIGQPRCGEKNLFIIFDSRNAIELPLIRRAFPDVPWLFLYRDPLEVLASQLSRRPMHTVPGLVEAELFGLDSTTAFHLSPTEYCARILARIFESGLNQANDSRCLLVNYKELSNSITSILNFLNGQLTESEKTTMVQFAKDYFENPGAELESGLAKIHQSTSAQIHHASEKLVRPLFEELERLRHASRLASSCR